MHHANLKKLTDPNQDVIFYGFSRCLYDILVEMEAKRKKVKPFLRLVLQLRLKTNDKIMFNQVNRSVCPRHTLRFGSFYNYCRISYDMFKA